MDFSFDCPGCNKSFKVSHEDLATKTAALKCCACGTTPPPDIMTAYANVGKTMTELYGCCSCAPAKDWLPKEIK